MGSKPFAAVRRRHARRSHRWNRLPRFEQLESLQLLATFTVTTVSEFVQDERLTLAEAIRLANAAAGADVIEFDLPASESEPIDPEGAGTERVFVFRLSQSLPALDDSSGGTTIDGFTQTTNGGDSNPAGPEVVLQAFGLEFGAGLVLQSAANLVRGLSVSGFANGGIQVRGNDNFVVGNYVGATADGLSAASNSDGIVVFGDRNQIGGLQPNESNLVSGNVADGIVVFGSNNQVLNNRIGVAADGISSLGNGVDGISISNFAVQNLIGQTAVGAGNTLAFNGRNGVTVAVNEEGADANSIRGNSIHSNVALGIDLTESSAEPDGVTPNDSTVLNGVTIHDADTGANQLQNFPELALALVGGGTTRIQGVLLSHASQSFVVDLYANDTLDASGFGEGRQYLGSIDVQTDSSGFAAIDQSVTTPASTFPIITATATDTLGNTSEFSRGVFLTDARFIAGTKRQDLTGDGFSADDLPMLGVRIELYQLDALPGPGPIDLDDLTGKVLIETTRTAADGSYAFDLLEPGIYAVAEQLDEQTLVQTAGGNLGNSFYSLDLRIEAEQPSSTGNDFANFLLVDLTGITWEDRFGDGFDAADLPRSGVTLQLFADQGDGQFDPQQDSLLQTTVSDANGQYEFSSIGPGLVFVVHGAGPGAVQTFGGDDFPLTEFYAVDTTSGILPASLDFGSFLLVQFAGQTLADLTGNGVTPDDQSLPDVLVELFRDQGDGIFDSSDELLAAVRSDALGEFEFVDNGPGQFFIRQQVPDGSQQTVGGNGGESYYTIVAQSGLDQLDLVFASAPAGTLTGRVWDDANANGLQDAGEPGLSNWTVNLTDDVGNRFEVLTDEVGQYTIRVSPGVYTVSESLESGWEQTFPLGRFDTDHAVPGGVLAGFALLADVIDLRPAPDPGTSGTADLIIGHDLESPVTNQGSLWIYPNPGDGLFSPDALPAVQINLGEHSRPRAAVSADLDADGDLDLAVATIGRGRTGEGPAGAVHVLINVDDTFELRQTLAVGTGPGAWPADGPIDLVAADLDGDGTLDLATADFRSHTVSILRGSGDGRFAVRQVIDSTLLVPRAIEVADLDDDGVAELLVAYHDSNQVVVLGADALGNFRALRQLPVNRPVDVLAGDLDLDGLPELIAAGSSGVTVYWNSPDQPFTAQSTLLPELRARSVALGDVNGDGTRDLVVASPDQASVQVVLNLHQRQFATETAFAASATNSLAGVAPQTVSLADLDGDGDQDIATGLAVGGACVLLNRQGDYRVQVEFGQTVGGLDFGNRFAGVAQIGLEAHDSLFAAGTNLFDLDLNEDGFLSPLDALLVINHLNQASETDSQRLDANGDGLLSPLDALLVINQLNARPEVKLTDVAAAVAESPIKRIGLSAHRSAAQ